MPLRMAWGRRQRVSGWPRTEALYHLEIDGEEMVEDRADPGGMIYLPNVMAGSGVRLGPAPPVS